AADTAATVIVPSPPRAAVVPPPVPPVEPPRPRPTSPPADVPPPRREPPAARAKRAAMWPWLAVGAVLAAIAVLALVGRTPSPPPPIRLASVDPSGEATLRVPSGEERRFAIVVADPQLQRDLGIEWQVDGQRAG